MYCTCDSIAQQLRMQLAIACVSTAALTKITPSLQEGYNSRTKIFGEVKDSARGKQALVLNLTIEVM